MVALETEHGIDGKKRFVKQSLGLLYNDVSILKDELSDTRINIDYYKLKDYVEKIYFSIASYLKHNKRYGLDDKHDRYNLTRAKDNLGFIKSELAKWRKIYLNYMREDMKGGNQIYYSKKQIPLRKNMITHLSFVEKALKELSNYDEEISVLNPSRHFIAILLSFAGLIGLYFTLSYLPIGTTAMFSSSTIFVSPLILILAVLFFLTTLIYFFRK